MKKEKILQFVFFVLMVIVVWVWARALAPKASPNTVSSDAAAKPGPHVFSGSPQTGPQAAFPLRSRKAKSSYADWGRNPLDMDSRRPAQSILSGILWDPQEPQAMINGEVVGVGGKVGVYTVMDIKPGSVILNDGTSDLELRLGQE